MEEKNKDTSFYQSEILFRGTVIDCEHRHDNASEANYCLEEELKVAIRYYDDWDAKIERDKSSDKEWFEFHS